MFFLLNKLKLRNRRMSLFSNKLELRNVRGRLEVFVVGAAMPWHGVMAYGLGERTDARRIGE
jgi:hypothetical protein